jgi:hypothetical protein
MHLVDGSYLDVWFSRKFPGRYAYHWERRHVDGSIYRHDNRSTFGSMFEALKRCAKCVLPGVFNEKFIGLQVFMLRWC